jgi:type VI protein secretion system component Hcp
MVVLSDREANGRNFGREPMGRTSKSKAKTSASKAKKRQRIKDLSPKDSKQVKGGTVSDISFTKQVNKASPVLF